MKRMLRLLLVLATISLLTTTAFADFGPKSQLIVRLETAPEELYYLDLLEEGSADDLHVYMDDEDLAALDADLYAAFLSQIPEGWHGCVSQGVTGAPIFGDLFSDSRDDDGNPLHTFGYHGVPDTYRILIVTEGGEAWVSETYTRTVLQSSVTVDWATKNVTIPATWVGYVLQFLATFVPTILLEGLLLMVFGLAKRRNWACFLLVNFITQGALAVYCSVTFLQNGFNVMFLLLLIPAEIVIALAETLLYRRWLAGAPAGRITLYAISANVLSAAAGRFLAEPVWRFVVSIS